MRRKNIWMSVVVFGCMLTAACGSQTAAADIGTGTEAAEAGAQTAEESTVEAGTDEAKWVDENFRTCGDDSEVWWSVNTAYADSNYAGFVLAETRIGEEAVPTLLSEELKILLYDDRTEIYAAATGETLVIALDCGEALTSLLGMDVTGDGQKELVFFFRPSGTTFYEDALYLVDLARMAEIPVDYQPGELAEVIASAEVTDVRAEDGTVTAEITVTTAEGETIVVTETSLTEDTDGEALYCTVVPEYCDQRYVDEEAGEVRAATGLMLQSEADANLMLYEGMIEGTLVYDADTQSMKLDASTGRFVAD